ncbi:hypothetical protein [Streptomyces cyaneus]|uniref:hypothetical protein n=1 Tax=Streptomyces cyaneus TaxID=1904 RepID=UPI000FF8A9BE|nr:hypothetical protein [Streptomyces cyaneus]
MRPTPARLATVAAALLIGVLAPVTAATPASALPLPLPATGAGGEPLVNVDGHLFAQPLVNNLNLPTLK